MMDEERRRRGLGLALLFATIGSLTFLSPTTHNNTPLHTDDPGRGTGTGQQPQIVARRLRDGGRILGLQDDVQSDRGRRQLGLSLSRAFEVFFFDPKTMELREEAIAHGQVDVLPEDADVLVSTHSKFQSEDSKIESNEDNKVDFMPMQPNGMAGGVYKSIQLAIPEETPSVLDIEYKPTLHDANETNLQAYTDFIDLLVVKMHGSGEPQTYTFENTPETSGIYFVMWTFGPKCTASAWRVEGDGTEFVDVPRPNPIRYENPKDYEMELNELDDNMLVIVKGDHAAWQGWHPYSYGHTLDYRISQIMHLKAQVHDECRFLLLDVGPLPEIFASIDPDFFSRITWLRTGQVAKVIEGNLIVGFRQDSWYAYPKFGANAYLQNWVNSLPFRVQKSEKIVIYQNRVFPQASHGRLMNAQHSQYIISLIKRKMEELCRPERLVIFDGKISNGDDNMRTMTPSEQFELFRTASTVIGSHGTGLSNVLWMDLQADEKPKVVEFTAGPQNINDRNLNKFQFRNYIRNYWGMPYDYHHILFTENSTDSNTFINLETLSDVLDELWS